ncbi:MAG: CotH kinase family protein [Lachnospiraceae bacterium]|nr:CotH kinase family protein [Lachnospiraceae bacterium]
MILATYICLVIVFAAFGIRQHEGGKVKGKLEISRETGNYYYDEQRGIRISGVDTDGVTYFLLPSYITDDRIEQSSNIVRIFLSDGTLLERANFGEIQDILVDYGDGQQIPWKMCFMKSSNLYSVFIDIENGENIESITSESYTDASISIYDADGTLSYADRGMEIKGRGNYSWQPDKKPLEMRFDSKVSICGLSPSKKWALLSDYFDPTMMMNKLALDLASELEVEYTTDCDWVDVYLGDMYMGNYLICKEPGTTADDAGCLFRKEIPHTYDKKTNKFISGGRRFVVDIPDEARAWQIESVKELTNEVDQSIRNGGYEEYISEESFIKRFLVEEYFYNADALSHSYYYYTHPGEVRLYAGPCWDYDLAGGNFYGAFGLYYDPDISILEMTQYPDYINDKEEWLDWDMVLFGYTEYKEKAKGIYADNLTLFENVLNDDIDIAYDRIRDSVRMDYVRWPEKEKHYRYYENEIRHLKFFMSERLNHMSSFFGIASYVKPENTDNGEYHDVRFILPDGSVTELTVSDGTCLGTEDLPVQADELTIWVNNVSEEALFSPFFPVYEDVEYKLVENTYES